MSRQSTAWAEISKELSRSVGKTAWAVWLKPCQSQLDESSGLTQLTLTAPDNKLGWVKQRYGALIEETTARVLKRPVEVRYLDTTPPKRNTSGRRGPASKLPKPRADTYDVVPTSTGASDVGPGSRMLGRHMGSLPRVIANRPRLIVGEGATEDLHGPISVNKPLGKAGTQLVSALLDLLEGSENTVSLGSLNRHAHPCDGDLNQQAKRGKGGETYRLIWLNLERLKEIEVTAKSGKKDAESRYRGRFVELARRRVGGRLLNDMEASEILASLDQSKRGELFAGERQGTVQVHLSDEAVELRGRAGVSYDRAVFDLLPNREAAFYLFGLAQAFSSERPYFMSEVFKAQFGLEGLSDTQASKTIKAWVERISLLDPRFNVHAYRRIQGSRVFWCFKFARAGGGPGNVWFKGRPKAVHVAVVSRSDGALYIEPRAGPP